MNDTVLEMVKAFAEVNNLQMPKKPWVRLLNKSTCPTCTKHIWLVCEDHDTGFEPAFFVCLECRRVRSVGKEIVCKP